MISLSKSTIQKIVAVFLNNQVVFLILYLCVRAAASISYPLTSYPYNLLLHGALVQNRAFG